MSKLNIEQQYLALIYAAVEYGVERVKERTGVGCKSLFNVNLKTSLKETFPQLTNRFISSKIHYTEFEWFMNGETTIDSFKKAGINIWDLWVDDTGNLGPVYGYQMRNFGGLGIDQLTLLIDQIKTNKDSRRHIVSLWNPAQIKDMALPPCYLYFQFFVDGDNLHMFVVQRAGDLLVGVPYDICVFSRFLLYVAAQTNLKADRLEISIVDAHVYNNHLEYVPKLKKTLPLPTFDYSLDEGLKITNYQYIQKLKIPVNK